MELDTLIDILIKEKGGTKEQYHSLMNKISHHESKGDPTIYQIGGGPGRGLFQFEEGDYAGGKTAANRLINYLSELNKPIPNWLKETKNINSLNASTLTPEQQKMLFLGNIRKHPKANFSNVWEGKESEEDFWANYHWAGKKEDEFKRRKSFQKSMSEFSESTVLNKPSKIKEKEIPFTKEQDGTYIKKSQMPKQDFKLNLDQFDLNKKSQLQRTELENKVLYQNMAAYGGILNSISTDKEFNSFNTGGTHEQNPLGGIPQGMGDNGKMNTVEEGETSYKFKDGKYIFSNRIKL